MGNLHHLGETNTGSVFWRDIASPQNSGSCGLLILSSACALCSAGQSHMICDTNCIEYTEVWHHPPLLIMVGSANKQKHFQQNPPGLQTTCLSLAGSLESSFGPRYFPFPTWHLTDDSSICNDPFSALQEALWSGHSRRRCDACLRSD